MSSEPKLICPVCGEKQGVGVDCRCLHCGFAEAYVPSFAGEQSRIQWQKKADEAKRSFEEQQKKAEPVFLAPGDFCMGSSCAAFRDAASGKLYLARSDGSVQVEENVLEFSSSERNYAVLYRDGKVKVYGNENSYGQCNTEEWREIRSVLSAPTSTCGVTEAGAVRVEGTRNIPELARWTEIRKLACGVHHVAGLRKDGHVLVGAEQKKALYEQAARWENVVDVAAAGDCVLALRTDGTVLFAGPEKDSRKETAAWKNIAAVAMDKNFAYGIDREGSMHVAGTCVPLLDQGRSQVGSWKELAAVACGERCVGAVDRSGNLHFTGTVSGDMKKILEGWDREIRPHVFE